MAKTLFVATLWFLALVTWGSIAHVFVGLPDVGMVAGLGAGVLLVASRSGNSGRSGRLQVVRPGGIQAATGDPATRA